MKAYHFVGATLRDGRPVPPDGEWLVHEGELVMCEAGLHACKHPFDALKYASDNVLCLVEEEDYIEEDDKLDAHQRKIITRRDATEILWSFASWCLPLRNVPEAVRQHLETGDETLQAAVTVGLIAFFAAEIAAVAAWAAAGTTAETIARTTQRAEFQRRIDELFAEV